jgi:hypothetical protein
VVIGVVTGVIARSAMLGAALGLGWGLAARIWMRLIATDPEFSWSGTGMILAAMTVVGLVLGILHGVRVSGGSGWWRLLVLLCLPPFAGPGLLFLPALLVGGLAFSPRARWHRAIGYAALTGASVLQWRLAAGSDESVNPWWLLGGFAVLSVGLAAGGAELYRPRMPCSLRQSAVPQRRG